MALDNKLILDKILTCESVIIVHMEDFNCAIFTFLGARAYGTAVRAIYCQEKQTN